MHDSLAGVDDGLAVRFTCTPLPGSTGRVDDGTGVQQWRVDAAVYAGDVNSGRDLSLEDPACRIGGAIFAPLWDPSTPLPVTVRYTRPSFTSAERLGTLDVCCGYGEVSCREVVHRQRASLLTLGPAGVGACALLMLPDVRASVASAAAFAQCDDGGGSQRPVLGGLHVASVRACAEPRRSDLQ